MQMIRTYNRRLALILAGTLAAIILSLFLSPARAEASVVCAVDSSGLDFGTSLREVGTISYTCTNYNNTPANFTLCAGIGNPTYPGSVSQPKLRKDPDALNFNVYVDAARTLVWTATNPVTKAISIPAGIGNKVSGTMLFYGNIPAGQPGGIGMYDAYFHNTVLGFVVAGQPACQRTGPPDLSGLDFSLRITAQISDACAFGTIGAIDFGTQAGLPNRVDAAGSVQVVCPNNKAWTLRFGGGEHASGGQRRMGSAAGNYVPYKLYRDAARTSLIAIDGTIAGTGNGAVQNQPVYGRVEEGAPPPVGIYTDRVVVTLSF